MVGFRRRSWLAKCRQSVSREDRHGVCFGMIEKRNLLSPVPGPLENELMEILASGSGEFKIERIVSRGHSSPADFWYEEKTSEWVMVLQGEGRIRLEEPEQDLVLQRGDWIEIPPMVRHRVEATSENEDTIWLAVHWKSK